MLDFRNHRRQCGAVAGSAANSFSMSFGLAGLPSCRTTTGRHGYEWARTAKSNPASVLESVWQQEAKRSRFSNENQTGRAGELFPARYPLRQATAFDYSPQEIQRVQAKASFVETVRPVLRLRQQGECAAPHNPAKERRYQFKEECRFALRPMPRGNSPLAKITLTPNPKLPMAE